MVDCAAGLHEHTVLRGSGQNETDIKSALESLMQSHQPLTNKPEFSACLAEQNTISFCFLLHASRMECGCKAKDGAWRFLGHCKVCSYGHCSYWLPSREPWQSRAPKTRATFAFKAALPLPLRACAVPASLSLSLSQGGMADGAAISGVGMWRHACTVLACRAFGRGQAAHTHDATPRPCLVP